MSPVAPPISKIGLIPKMLSLTIVRIDIKLPIWRESAVGSNPAYALTVLSLRLVFKGRLLFDSEKSF